MRKVIFTSLLLVAVVLVGTVGTMPYFETRLNYAMPVFRALNFGTLLDQVIGIHTGEEILTGTVAMDSSTFDVTALRITGHMGYINGTFYDFPDTTKALTGTTHDVDNKKWASFRVVIAADSTVTVTKSASTYSTEALAIAAVPAVTANNIDLGYFTIYGGTGSNTFDATTDTLAASIYEGRTVTYYLTTNYFLDLEAN
ncbi:MAG: hypothetical protein PHV11_06295 [Candidatus Bipolaricaulis sp.]|nr:hypothetical protein [Candidatus Bipolaricaulis sp.]